MASTGELRKPSGWLFPARTTLYFIVVAALSMATLAFSELGARREANQQDSEIRLDRAARSSVALFEQKNGDFVIGSADGGSPEVVMIDSIDRLEPDPAWDSLLDTVSAVNEGAANLFRYNTETAAFDRISTTFTDPTGARVGNSQVELGLISLGHPAYDTVTQGQPFIGEVPVAGRLRYAYLTPIVDSQSELIGILAVDVGLVDDLNASNSQSFKHLLRTMIVLLVAMAALGIIVMFWAFRPLNRLIGVAADVGSDSSRAPIELTGRRDEIGYLANGLAKVVDLQKDLERRAYTDDLTGIPNRAAFVRELERRFDILGGVQDQQASSFALLIIDLDSFKEVNDVLGHQAGDDLLVSISSSLTNGLESGEFLARLGGDEFALLTAQNGAEADAIDAIAGRAAQCVGGVRRTQAGDTGITASIGIAIIPEHGDAIKPAMTHADLALYAVKRAGRGTAQLYDPSLSSPIQRRIHLATELRRALQDNRITLAFQPLYAAGDGRLRSVEALARWTHEDEGPIPPLEFVGVAEKSGLINELGSYVIEQGCAQIASWRNEGLDVPVVAINVSIMQLWHPSFVDGLRDSLVRHDVALGGLSIEITESVLMHGDDQRTRKALSEISALGVPLSIDDFGTGYSSLSYLHDLSVQQVKIDRIFVADAVSDQKQAQLFAGIVSLGSSLGLEVVVEGVETQADLDFVRGHRVDLIQGWFLDKAMSAETVSTKFGSTSPRWGTAVYPPSTLSRENNIPRMNRDQSAAACKNGQKGEAAFEVESASA